MLLIVLLLGYFWWIRKLWLADCLSYFCCCDKAPEKSNLWEEGLVCAVCGIQSIRDRRRSNERSFAVVTQAGYSRSHWIQSQRARRKECQHSLSPSTIFNSFLFAFQTPLTLLSTADICMGVGSSSETRVASQELHAWRKLNTTPQRLPIASQLEVGLQELLYAETFFSALNLCRLYPRSCRCWAHVCKGSLMTSKYCLLQTSTTTGFYNLPAPSSTITLEP